MSRVVSLRLKDEQIKRLSRIAHRFNKTLTEAAAQLLEEAIRQEENPYIEFRSTISGREVYIHGSRLKVWHIAMMNQDGKADPAEIAAGLEIPEHHVRAALAYAAAYPDEIEAAIENNDWAGAELVPILPGYRPSSVDTPAS